MTAQMPAVTDPYGWCGMVKYARWIAAAFVVFTASVPVSARAQTSESYALMKMDHARAQTAATDRQQKMLADADQLVAMAQQLKVAVDGTRKDQLSIEVIRQADQIEKLARSVKERMRQ